MKPFAQSILTTDFKALGPETAGDCMRACVASILEIDPSNLPNPHGESFGDWGTEWRKALASFGVQPVWVGDDPQEQADSPAMKAWWAIDFPGYWLATVKLDDDEKEPADREAGADGIGHHCVVMLWDQLAHDPYPWSVLNSLTAEELRAKIVHATVFLPVDPKLAVRR